MPPPSEAAMIALAQRAREAAEAAYVPYSRFHVGAAIETADGTVFTAANVENASYGLSLCAETNAAMAAALAGKHGFRAVAVVGWSATDMNGGALAAPCGRCRQILSEFAGPDCAVRIERRDPAAPAIVTTLSALLPHAFGPAEFHKPDA
ncbi:cytidine deaminase [Acuticoccus sp. MNP-M23]|uniref:cytidine deaminase n=1 Tax=Acuticoccus sp. MNP-M23 TaxID=3072793 RepID=UPI0028156B9C|nr:cytidine deaminase [Acuticoccus sp. MNP-M23]WMS41490.1 cytidine deaminase [Acuticoccus sp. MNP-M23]